MKIKKSLPIDLETIIPLLIGVWRRYFKLSGPPDVLQTREFRTVVTSVQQLIHGLETGDELRGQDYFSNPDLLGAYLMYQWAVHYQQGLSLIGEIPEPPRRVLDIASGPAPLAFAALRHGAREVIALDQNETALRLGAEVCGRYGFPLTIRKHQCLKMPFPVEGKFDLIMVGHCLEELFSDTREGWEQKQESWIKNLFSYLTPNGFLLLIESPLIGPNRRLLTLRDRLVKGGVPVQAPCVWKGECPALQAKNSPCYAQREFEKPYLLKEIQRAAEINLGSLKMSYLILRNPESGWPVLPQHPVHRVISPPIDAGQGKRFYLCGTEGKKLLESNLTEHSKEARAFDYLKRGELISIEEAIERKNRFEVTPGTRIRIEAALGKPLPSPE